MDFFIGELRLFPTSRIPDGWLPCDGRQLQIDSYKPLFSLLGTAYGGNGTTTFSLPDLRGRVAMGQDPYGQFPLGRIGGSEINILTQVPAHTHNLMAAETGGTQSSPANNLLATTIDTSTQPFPELDSYYSTNQYATLNPASVGNSGSSTPIQNMQPYLALIYCMATKGIYPSRSTDPVAEESTHG
ncbi:MAG: phage tail protein [Alphaproteobacteria bacterium]|nr:MAG: phage tail protein [Alphaproteobacteria bacterium]